MHCCLTKRSSRVSLAAVCRSGGTAGGTAGGPVE